MLNKEPEKKKHDDLGRLAAIALVLLVTLIVGYTLGRYDNRNIDYSLQNSTWVQVTHDTISMFNCSFIANDVNGKLYCWQDKCISDNYCKGISVALEIP